MQTKTEHALIFEHTRNFNALNLLTYLLFQFPVPVKYSLLIADDLSKQVRDYLFYCL